MTEATDRVSLEKLDEPIDFGNRDRCYAWLRWESYNEYWRCAWPQRAKDAVAKARAFITAETLRGEQ